MNQPLLTAGTERAELRAPRDLPLRAASEMVRLGRREPLPSGRRLIGQRGVIRLLRQRQREWQHGVRDQPTGPIRTQSRTASGTS
jgi:hypothetical protein